MPDRGGCPVSGVSSGVSLSYAAALVIAAG
jgi:hypothetical protein